MLCLPKLLYSTSPHQVNGLGVNFPEMARAALNTALTQVMDSIVIGTIVQ